MYKLNTVLTPHIKIYYKNMSSTNTVTLLPPSTKFYVCEKVIIKAHMYFRNQFSFLFYKY